MKILKTAKFWIYIIIIIVIITYETNIKNRRETEGIITIAKIEKFEAAEQGGDLYIAIFYRGNQYKTVVNTNCLFCKKDYYFIKIFPNEPLNNPSFYEDKPVPECILESPLPHEGWKEIPKDTCGLSIGSVFK